jgi:hypothetical protein
MSILSPIVDLFGRILSLDQINPIHGAAKGLAAPFSLLVLYTEQQELRRTRTRKTTEF